MISFRIFNFPVTVQWPFWLTSVFLVGVDHMKGRDAILNVALCVAAAFVSILVHELGHAYFQRKFGAYSEIVLHAFGGYAAASGPPRSRGESMIITAAGPGVQFLLGLVCLVLARQLPQIFDGPTYVAFFWSKLMVISFIWAIFNCLPIFPMDGGQFFAALSNNIRITGLVGCITAALVLALYVKFGAVTLFSVIFLGSLGWNNFKTFKNGYYDPSGGLF